MAIILTVDAVLLTLVQGELEVALFKRDAEPFKGLWALPGGYVHEDKDDHAGAAAARVLKRKAGVVSPYLEEYGTFSGPGRDPRGWSLTVVYYALVPPSVLGDTVQRFQVGRLPALPFDHAQIIAGVVARVRNKAAYSSLPAFLCGDQFTVPELHAVYEAVLAQPLNLPNFRRKLDDLGILEEVPGATKLGGRNRPAQLYRLKKQFRSALSVRERGL